MSDARKSRGRPKGSGIDDAGTLDAISALIAADPGLRPTTAIKQLGFSDPSVVRRLRDKFKTARSVAAPVVATDHSKPKPARQRPAPQHHPMPSMACAGLKPFELRGSATEAPARDAYKAAAVAMCAANISAAQTALAANYTLTKSALENPFFAFAIHQQLLLQDMALSFFTHAIDRRTLH